MEHLRTLRKIEKIGVTQKKAFYTQGNLEIQIGNKMIEMFLKNISPGLPEQVVELCWPLNCSFLGHGTRYILQKSGEVYPDIRSRGHRTSNIHVRMFGDVRYFLNIEMLDVRMFANIKTFASLNVRMFVCSLKSEWPDVRCLNVR